MSTNALLGAASGLSEIPLYPLLTREVDHNGSSSRASASSGAPGTGLAALAKNAIRASLGWQHRGGDATANLKSFQAALGKAFKFKEVDGATQWEWVPQGFSVQADLGEITGAQASIYRQARAMLEQTLPVLEKIEALRESADEDDIESMRAIIRSELTDLVDELGRPGGPRVQRVDHFFCLLLAAHESKPAIYDPQDARFGGQLRRFLGRLGMSESRVNTVAEEVQYTDCLLLVDNIASLHRTWLHKRPYFNGVNTPFFGTLLMHLSRQMEVIAESVHELYSTLDSVYIGPAERQIVDLGSHVVFVDADTGQPVTDNTTKPETFKKHAACMDDKALTSLFADAEDKASAKQLLQEIQAAKTVSEALADIRELIELDDLDEDDRDAVLDGFKLKLETVGAEARSLSLEGLLGWIETFVTSEGRLLLEQGGKDGAVTFACTICKFAEFVGHLLDYSAQYAAELHAEIGSALTKGRTQTSSLLDFHPGLHSTRVYRAIRELHTHLRAACRLSSKIDYRAAICSDELESENDCTACDDRTEIESFAIPHTLRRQVVPAWATQSDAAQASKVSADIAKQAMPITPTQGVVIPPPPEYSALSSDYLGTPPAAQSSPSASCEVPTETRTGKNKKA